MARNVAQNDAIALPSAAFLLGQSVASVLCWFRVPANTSFCTIYAEAAAFNEEIFIRLNSSGFLDTFWRTPAAIASFTGSTAFDDGNWHRLLYVRRGNADFQAYVDEVSQGTSTNNPGTATPTMTVNVGQHPGVGTEGLRGDIARFIVLTRAVTADEAKGILYGAHPGLNRRVWLEMGYGSPEPDFSGTATPNNGTLTNTTVVAHPPMGYPFWSGNGGANTYSVAAAGLSISVAMYNYRRRRTA